MNTDNVSIAGETIDYGPCAFMDAYHPETVFSSIDQHGRYAYGKQPQIGGWNMARLGEALMPLFSDDTDEALKQANESLQTYNAHFGARADRRAAPQARPVHRAGRRRRAGAGFPERARPTTAPTSPSPSAASATARRAACSRSRRRSMPGPQRWRARTAAEPQDEATRRAAMQRGQSALHSAQPSRRSRASAPRSSDERLRPVRGTAGGARQAVRGAARIRRLRRAARANRSSATTERLRHLTPAPSERSSSSESG